MKKIMTFILLFSHVLLLSAKVISVGIYENKPLVYIDDKKEPQGFYIDILEDVAHKEKWEINYVYRSWEQCLDLLKKDSLDLLVDIAYSEKRDSIYDYNSENVFLNWGQVYAENKQNINSILDLNNKRIIGVEKDIYFEETLKMLDKFGIITEVIYVKEYPEVFQALEDKKADAGVVNRLFGILNDQNYKIKITGIMIRPSELRFATPQGRNNEILSALDFHLRQMKADRNSIYFKSMNTHMSGLAMTDRGFFMKNQKIILSLALILLVLIHVFVIRRNRKNYKVLLNESTILAENLEQYILSLPLCTLIINNDLKVESVSSCFWQKFEIHSADLLNKPVKDFIDIRDSNFSDKKFNDRVKIFSIKGDQEADIQIEPIIFSGNRKFLLYLDKYSAQNSDPVLNHSEMLESFLESLPAPVMITDPEGNILLANQIFLSEIDFNNFASFKSIHSTVFDLIDGAMIQKMHDQLKNLPDNEILSIKSNIFKNYGDPVLCDINVQKWRMSENDYMIFSLKNQSSEKALAEDVHYRTLFFKELFEKTPLAIAVLNEEKIIMDINKEFIKMFGYSKEDLIGKYINDFIIPDELKDQSDEFFHEVLDKKRLKMQAIRKRKDNVYLPVQIYGSQIMIEDKFAGIFALYEDKTDENNLINELRESVRFLDSLLEKSQDMIIVLKPDSTIEKISESFTKTLGYSLVEIFDTRNFFISHVHPEDRSHVNNSFYELVNTGKNDTLKFRIMKKNGDFLWLEEKAIVLRDHDNKPEHIVIISRDISDYKMSEEKLQHQKKFISGIMDRVEDGILNVGIDGKINYLNNSMAQIFHEIREDLINTSLFDLIELENSSIFNSQYLYDLFVDGDKQFNNVIMKVKKAETKIVCNVSSMPLTSEENGKTLLLFIRDLTYQKKIQAELQKLKNLEIMQNYTLHLANDFNNILTAIMGHIALLKMNTTLEPAIQERVKKAEEASRKAIELTQKIFPVDTNQNIIRDYCPVSALIEFVEHLLPANYILNKFIDVQDTNVYINQSLTESLLKKIVDNALESMPKGGTLILRTDEIKIEQSNMFSLLPGNYIRMSLIDQGYGIEDHILEKIFDPYFSTKNKDGLGLTQAFHLIKLQKGYIHVQSQKDVGTFVDIYLPLNPYEEDLINESEIDLSQIHLLFMDDESLVNDIAEEYLTRFGFNITIIQKGEQLMPVMEQKGRFDLYILDLVIADGMGAKDTLQLIRSVDPQAKVILSTGLRTEPTLLDYRKFGFNDTIEKPIDFHLLKIKILRLLKK